MKRVISNIYWGRDLPKNPKNSDLYVVEFPKSGITWLSTILSNTCFLKEGVGKRASYFNTEQFIGDVHLSKNISDNMIFPYFRIIKSHANYNPYYRNVLYLSRNPFSVMESYYNYALSNNIYSGEVEDFVRHPKLGVSCWTRHVMSWLNPKRPMNLHHIRFEDLKRDPGAVIQALYQNLGWEIDPTIVSQSIERSSFENMKASDELYNSHCPFKKYSFVREGKAESSVSERVRRVVLEEARTPLKLIYPEYL